MPRSPDIASRSLPRYTDWPGGQSRVSCVNCATTAIDLAILPDEFLGLVSDEDGLDEAATNDPYPRATSPP